MRLRLAPCRYERNRAAKEKLYYDYDVGTATELTMQVISDQIEGINPDHVRIVARNGKRHTLVRNARVPQLTGQAGIRSSTVMPASPV